MANMGFYFDGDWVDSIGDAYISSNTGLKERNFCQKHLYQTSVWIPQKSFTKQGRYKIVKKEINPLLPGVPFFT